MQEALKTGAATLRYVALHTAYEFLSAPSLSPHTAVLAEADREALARAAGERADNGDLAAAGGGRCGADGAPGGDRADFF